MVKLLKAAGVIQVAIAIATLTAVAAFAAHASLPSAADAGQERAAAGAANGQAADAQGGNVQGEGFDAEVVTDQLSENHDLVLANLDAVLERLEASDADQAAVDALEMVIEMLANDDIGLNRASDAVTNQGVDEADLPPALDGLPTPDDHPGRP